MDCGVTPHSSSVAQNLTTGPPASVRSRQTSKWRGETPKYIDLGQRGLWSDWRVISSAELDHRTSGASEKSSNV